MKHLLESILKEALTRQASDIHITSTLKTNIEFRIKGNLFNYKQLKEDEGEGLINYIKFISGLSLDYRYNLNTGSFTYTFNHQSHRFRVSSIPTLNGNHLVIRLLDNIVLNRLEDLTKDIKMIEILRKIEDYHHGLILISGPTGVGKSTTLHVLLNEIYAKRKCNIITIEDPIEMIVPEFTQIQISSKISYDKALNQILRHDPDVIMIGELRDAYSAKLALRSALTGCLVFATIHSKDSKSTLNRLYNLDVDKVELNEVLKGIISQQLIYTNHSTTAIFEYYDPILDVFHSFNNSKEYL